MEGLKKIAREQTPKQKWPLNNVALKYLRSRCEEPEGTPMFDDTIIDLPLDSLLVIGQMWHAENGPAFSFTHPEVVGKMQAWSPAQFIAAFRPDAMRKLGLEEHGVMKLQVQCMSGTFDLLRRGVLVFWPGCA